MLAAPVMGKVAAVAAAERTQLALVRFLPGVRAHVSFKMALIGRCKGTQMAAMGLFTCVYANMFYETSCAFAGIVTVTAF